MAEEEKNEQKSLDPEVVAEEVAKEKEAAADGSQDILTVLVSYAKRMNGYPYISASRIERMIDSTKGERSSFLFEQLCVNFMAKNAKSGPKDFMDVFGNGRLVLIQAHASCPTMGDDGLYNAMDPNGKYIKTQLVGHFALNPDKMLETDDKVSDPNYDYFYFDANEQYMGLQVNDNTPLDEYYKIHGKLFRQLKIPFFEPLVVVKQGPDKFGCIHGNPFPSIPTAAAATLLKNASLLIRPEEPKQSEAK